MARSRDYGWVYFIHAPEVSRTKVGWTINNPQHRMAELQTGSPCELFLDGVIPGRSGDEAKFHGLFKNHNVAGEWFGDHELLSIFRDRLSFSSPSDCGWDWRL